MEKVEELNIDKRMVENEDEDMQRLFASVKVALGFKIHYLGPNYVLHHRNIVNTVKTFLQQFSESAKVCNSKKSTKVERIKALKKCKQLCNIKFSSTIKNDENAAKLLLGAEDADPWITEQKLSDVIVLPPLEKYTGMLTASIRKLISISEPEPEHPYNIGRQLFYNSFRNSDMFAGGPLETSYYWALSVGAAMKKKISFIQESYKATFKIDCRALMPGRLFPSNNSSDYKLDFLKMKGAETTIYYVDERKDGKSTHPLADMFFLSGNQLVLVDITGSSKHDIIKNKLKNLREWISKHKSNSDIPYVLRGVVLAPNLNCESRVFDEDGTMQVSGDDAIILLGGLRQLRRWMD
jgi:hypothetical protein